VRITCRERSREHFSCSSLVVTERARRADPERSQLGCHRDRAGHVGGAVGPQRERRRRGHSMMPNSCLSEKRATRLVDGECLEARRGARVPRRARARAVRVVARSSPCLRGRIGAGQRVGRSERRVLAARECGAPRASLLTDAPRAVIWSGQPIATASHSPVSSLALQTSAIVSTGSAVPLKPGTAA
jgi:hypothetical protein